MVKKTDLLLIEDSASLAAMYAEYLRDEPISIRSALTGKDALASMQEMPPEVVLLDLKLPDISGQEILSWIKEQGLPCAIVVMTAHGSVDIAVEVMRLGAHDFLQKPFNGPRLTTTIRNVIEKNQLMHLVEDLQQTYERHAYHGFIGGCLPMQAVYKTIDAVAVSKATVFITGESGTGKEVCAEAIHLQGPLKDSPFIALNCGAIPRDLMESEIFGHVKGAFTGAVSERKGAALMADGGTLFLDEIGEMDLDLQTKLLRFIQTGIIKKVGGSKEMKVDVRFICATNRDPLQEVSEGRFREDLYYRLNVVPIHLCPLRERGGDVLMLAKHFLSVASKEENKAFVDFSPEVECILGTYEWPGNIRQLQNVIRNIVVLHNAEVVNVEHLPPPLNSIKSNSSVNLSTVSNKTFSSPSGDSEIRSLAAVERDAIERAIDFCDGNIPKAAALLEVSPSTIYRKKQAW